MTAHKSSALTRFSALFALVLLAAVSTAESAALSGGHTEPSPSQRRPAHVGDSSLTEPYPFHRLVTSGGIRLYQKLISPARGASCPMHPHCSAYGHQAFQTREPLRALMMTADRLIRCGHDLEQYPSVTVNGFLRYSDPVADENSGGGGKASTARKKWPSPGGSPDDSTISYVHNVAPEPEHALYLFAQQLSQEGDFDRAITEYRRYITYFPESPNRPDAELAVVRCYYDAGRYAEAIEYGKKVLSREPPGTTTESVVFTIGLAGLRSGQYETAHEHFRTLATNKGPLGEMAVMAQGLTYTHQFDWQRGEETFASVSDSSGLGMKARYCARLCREGQQLGRKNPHLAGVLAIVPGLGYLYDGYYQTALSALVVNGLFMWGTYEAFEQDHPGLGVTLAVFGIGWYAGNIYGSVTSAERRNEKSRHDLLLRFDIGYEF